MQVVKFAQNRTAHIFTGIVRFHTNFLNFKLYRNNFLFRLCVPARPLKCNTFYSSMLHRYLCSVLLTKYHSGDQVKKTEMGRTCGTYGGEERCIKGFSGET
jgi:hypothetical protein